jgi:hypothetical protein
MRRRRRSIAAVKIRHCVWRDGRPRFQPGPGLRALGFAGRDLRHPDGAWFSLEEATRFAVTLAKEADIIRAKAAGRAAPAPAPLAVGAAPAPPAPPCSLGHVIADELALRRAAIEAPARAANGARAASARALAPKTLKWYSGLAARLQDVAPDQWAALAIAFGPAEARALYDRLNGAIGHASARGVIALCSMAFAAARLRAGPLKDRPNPFERLGIPASAPRVRVASPQEIAAFVAAADRLGRPELADMALLAVWTGQRQADRFALIITTRDGAERAEITQAKTGATVSIRLASAVVDRLAAARARRRAASIDRPEAIIDERARAPWDEHAYRKAFATIRAEAAKAAPSIADLRDQDFRDTAVTWLARAGCTVLEIASITGHSLQSATQILRHYALLDEQIADQAITKLTKWAQGA